MSLKTALISIVLLMWTSLAIGQGISLTLEECIKQGFETNPQILSYRLAIDESEQAVYEAWGDFLPTVTIDYGKTNLENNLGAVTDSDYLSQESESFSVGVTQPLFSSFSGVSGLRIASGNKETRELDLTLRKQRLLADIRVSFYELLKAKELVHKWDESIGRLKEQRKIAKAWVEQQLATKLRLLDVEVEMANAEQKLIESQTARSIAESNLTELLGFTATSGPVEIVGELQTPVELVCDDLDTCIDVALEQRPDLQAAELKVRLAREDAKLVLARNLPHVSLDARWVDYNREYDNNLLNEEERDYYTVGLNVRMRPFQGGKNIFAYRRTRLAIERYEVERISRENAIANEVKTRYQQLLEARGRLDSTQHALNEAREGYTYVAKGTKLEVNSLDDLLVAELRLTRAEISKIEAEFALQRARTFLNYAVGGELILKDSQ